MIKPKNSLNLCSSCTRSSLLMRLLSVTGACLLLCVIVLGENIRITCSYTPTEEGITEELNHFPHHLIVQKSVAIDQGLRDWAGESRQLTLDFRYFPALNVVGVRSFSNEKEFSLRDLFEDDSVSCLNKSLKSRFANLVVVLMAAEAWIIRWSFLCSNGFKSSVECSLSNLVLCRSP